MKGICSSEYIKGYKESLIAQNETNDCFVRAIASTFNLDYDTSHKFVAEEFNRQPRKGTYEVIEKLTYNCQVLGRYYRVIPSYHLSYISLSKYKNTSTKSSPITLRIFLQLFPEGHYLVVTRDHAFSVIDGIIVGNEEDSEKLKVKILFALRAI